MYVERTNQYEAGERVQGRLGAVVEQENLSIERMLDMVFGPKQTQVENTENKTTKKEATK
jgi:hypothetical protein